VKVSYTYPATVLDVIDGDTLHLDLELGRARHRNHDYGFHLYAEGFALRLHLTGRLLGLNAAEHGTPGGDAATANLTALLPPGTACQVITSPSRFSCSCRACGVSIMSASLSGVRLVRDAVSLASVA